LVKPFVQEFPIQLELPQFTYYPIRGSAVSVRIHQIRKARLELRRKSFSDALHNLSPCVPDVYHVLGPQSTALPVSDVHNRQLKRRCFDNPRGRISNHGRGMAHEAEIALRSKVDRNLTALCISFDEFMNQFNNRMALRIRVRISAYYWAVHLSERCQKLTD